VQCSILSFLCRFGAQEFAVLNEVGYAYGNTRHLVLTDGATLREYDLVGGARVQNTPLRRPVLTELRTTCSIQGGIR
jgi:hypothetical protein